MQRWFILGSILAATLSCEATPICLPMAEPSVITIKNDQGKLVEAQELRYTVDGGPAKTLTCGPGGDSPSCSSWEIESGTWGTFVITAAGCGVEATITVEVKQGECGSIPEHRDLVLPCST